MLPRLLKSGRINKRLALYFRDIPGSTISFFHPPILFRFLFFFASMCTKTGKGPMYVHNKEKGRCTHTIKKETVAHVSETG